MLSSFSGWTEAYTGFIEGRRTDPAACMVFRWVQGIMSLSWIALPAVLWAGMNGKPMDHLKLRGLPDLKLLLLAGIALVFAMPLVEYMIIRPQQVHLPEAWKNLEQWLQEQGKDTMVAVQHLLADTSGPGLVANLFFLSLLPAVSEELLFRGFLQQSLGKLMRPAFAITLTAAAFSLMHLQLLVFLPRFFLGILLSYFFWKSGKLWVSMAGHFAFNATNVLLAFFSAKGILPKEMIADQYSFPIWVVLVSAAATLGATLLFKKLSDEKTELKAE